MGISSELISLEIASPDVPDLTLIDLPGIARVAVDGQSADIGDKVWYLSLPHNFKAISLVEISSSETQTQSLIGIGMLVLKRDNTDTPVWLLVFGIICTYCYEFATLSGHSCLHQLFGCIVHNCIYAIYEIIFLIFILYFEWILSD